MPDNPNLSPPDDPGDAHSTLPPVSADALDSNEITTPLPNTLAQVPGAGVEARPEDYGGGIEFTQFDLRQLRCFFRRERFRSYGLSPDEWISWATNEILRKHGHSIQRTNGSWLPLFAGFADNLIKRQRTAIAKASVQRAKDGNYARGHHRNRQEPSPHKTVALKEMLDLQRQAISEAPPQYRNVLTCRFLSGLSQRDTAEVLDIPEGTVKSSCSRALAWLQRWFEEHGVELVLDTDAATEHQVGPDEAEQNEDE